MPSGNITTGALTDSLNTIVAAARIVREYEGIMSQLVDTVTLGEGNGLTWHEVSFAQLTAQSVTESTVLDNPQMVSDTDFNITPTVCGIQTFITDRVRARLAKVAYAKIGSLAQNAIERKKDEDLLVVLDGAGTSLGGAGTSLNSGLISAAKSAISSNATEPGLPPYRCVLHGFQIKDLSDELTAGVGTYPVGEGPTARVFQSGFKLPVAGVEVFEDGNIAIDSSDDAKGGVFAKEAIVLVRGRSPWKETRREPHIGGGGDSVWLYDEYAAGERSAGNWLRELYTDATSPTS